MKKQTLTNLAEVLQKNFLLLKKQYSIDLPPPSILISKLSIANQKNRSDKKTLSTITQICHQIENMPENTVLNWKNIPFSQFRFIRLFKENTGLSPHKFLIQNRVRKAQQLLLNSHCSLAEVAQATGFYDQSHFIRHFKAMVGLTPSEYQQSCVFFAKK